MFKTSLIFITCFFCINLSFASAAEKKQHVKNLNYGLALYHFYQQQPLQAITVLEASLHKNTLQSQHIDAQLLLGSLYFEYGLSNSSKHIFSDLLNAQQNDSKKTTHHKSRNNKIWFNLAKVEYAQANDLQTSELLALIQGPLETAREAEKHYLLSNIYNRQQQFDEALSSSQKIPKNSIWSLYARYNLALSFIQHSDQKQQLQGTSIMQQLSQSRLNSAEAQSIKQASLLSLGLFYLNQSQSEKAIQALSKIHLSGPLSNRALLAMGSAFMQQNQAEKALTYWQQLQLNQQHDIATQESYLSLANAFEQLQQDKQAIVFYQQADSHFNQLIDYLSTAKNDIAAGELILSLHQQQLLEAPLSDSIFESAPPSPAINYLYLLFVDQQFQQGIKNYQELLNIKNTLSLWQNKLPTLDLMLAQRQLFFTQKQALVDQSTDADQLLDFQQQRDEFAIQLDDIKKNPQSLALSTEDEADFLEQVEYIQSLLTSLKSKRDITAEQLKLNRLAGLLNWEISTDYAPRFWHAKNELQQLDKVLQQAQKSAHSLVLAAPQNEQKLSAFKLQISAQNKDLKQLSENTEKLILKQQQHINLLAIKTLTDYQKNIQHLQLNVRHSLARLFDKLATNRLDQ